MVLACVPRLCHTLRMEKRKTTHTKRTHVSFRLPEWIVEWLDGVPNSTATRTSLVEYALRKTFKLKEPK